MTRADVGCHLSGHSRRGTASACPLATGPDSTPPHLLRWSTAAKTGGCTSDIRAAHLHNYSERARFWPSCQGRSSQKINAILEVFLLPNYGCISWENFSCTTHLRKQQTSFAGIACVTDIKTYCSANINILYLPMETTRVTRYNKWNITYLQTAWYFCHFVQQ